MKISAHESNSWVSRNLKALPRVLYENKAPTYTSSHKVLIKIKSKLLMPAKPLQVSGNVKSMIPLWDRRQLSPPVLKGYP